MKRDLWICGARPDPGVELCRDHDAQVNDAWITMKTKIELMTTKDLHTSGLNVDTKDGVVTLQGKVESDAERQKPNR